MRAELIDFMTVEHDNEVIEILQLSVDREQCQQDYVEVCINNINMTLSNEDFNKINSDFYRDLI